MNNLKHLTKTIYNQANPSMTNILIIGAGPTGIGAAYRLWQRKEEDWLLCEKEDHLGGLAASFRDEKGFTWDIGGHVMFSHYEYFDDFINHMLGDAYISHLREAYIWMLDRWIPYPFQNNLRYLPEKIQEECLKGLIEDRLKPEEARNFKEWTYAVFGEAVSRYFMDPYNFKVWAHPLEEMCKEWIGERVSVVDYKRILSNIIHKRDDVAWGPNNQFKFPLHGGTGGLFSPASKLFGQKLLLNRELEKIYWKEKIAVFKDKSEIRYDKLVTTLPLDLLCKMVEPSCEDIENASRNLVFTSGYIIGIGLKKRLNSRRCWMYFPQDDSPFYRVTNFGWYSCNNVPDGDTEQYSSYMCETSYSSFKKVSKDEITEKTIDGLVNSRLLSKDDISKIISTYIIDVKHSYPVPGLKRNKALSIIQPWLEERDIFSRGRFGGWKYEVGNMDHSVMTGREIVDRIIDNTEESVYKI